ncbi:hypothetical protein E3E14_25305 [Streptomyces sp. ICN441]|uniref:hypothetical protein n=1 Tax=Streptomyces sp. ICN441 TaxID=2558286 RepID=UPI00106948E6|nr:hypothetical protein [Streptomyces sp. ICN441]TFE42504.1 hypothetical protein E3E14_25305 [Streptomyces sp. ICN441]
MYLIYKPEGKDEQRWRYTPRRGLLSVEREDIERRTGKNYAEFTQAVLKGNSLCRRALLFVFLRRDHAKLRWEDVDFEWDELQLEYSKQEWEDMREQAMENLHGDELAAALASFDKFIAEAIDDDDPGHSGKARQLIAD